jgi:DNA-binding NarL/FixJ family response regulator
MVAWMDQSVAKTLPGITGVLVSACPIFRSGLRDLLGASLPEVKLLQYESIPSDIELHDQSKHSARWCILADTGRPDQPFTDWVGIKRLHSAGTRIVALVPSLTLPPTEILRSLGVTEVLALSATGPDILAALQRTMEPRTSSRSVITKSSFEKLSSAELQVAVAIVQGASLKEIANDMGVSDKTVSTYKSRIKDKLGIETNAELYRMLAVGVSWLQALGNRSGAGGQG